MGLVFRRTPVRLIALPVGVLQWYAMAGYDQGSFVFWKQLEGNLAAFGLFTAAIAVLTSGLSWQLIWQPAGVYVPSRTAQTSQPFWRIWIAFSAWTFLGWVGGVLGGVLALGDAIVGDPNFLMLSAIAGLIPVFGALGFVVGRWLPRWIGPLLAGVGAYIGLGLLMYGGAPIRKIAPISDGVPPFGSAFSQAFLSLQIAFLSVVAVGIVYTFVSAEFRRHFLPSIAVWLVAIGLGFVLVVSPIMATSPTSRDCRGTDTEVCGPNTLLDNTERITGVIDEVSHLLNVSVDRATLQAGRHEFDEVEETLFVDIQLLQVDIDRAAASAFVGPTIAECRNVAARDLVIDALTVLADPGGDGVSPLSRDVAEGLRARKTWLSDNIDRLRRCDISFDELPGLP